jgi:hypothetical protein
MNKNQIKDLMKKTNFTIDGRSGLNTCFLFILALGLWIMPGQTHGQGGNCSLACNSKTQISLDENCDTEVTWDMILNASNTSCPGGEFVVTVSKKHGLPILTSPFVNKAHINQTLVAEVRDLNSGNRCWGEILVEDKLPPQIDCRNDTLFCYEMRNYAGPLATDNCQKAAFLHSEALSVFTFYDGPPSYPWRGGPDYDDYTTSMDAVFGEGMWDDLTYESLNPAIVFSKAYCYIYMEGSDYDANELNAFLNANRALVEKWVSDGGRLFINAAPNEGGNINFGFGNPAQGIPNVTLLYPGFRNSVYAPDVDHPVIQGPFQPTGTQFSGNDFGHGLVCPPGMNNILEATSDSAALLIEAAFGDGYVMFGGMTASGFHSPQPHARNLKWNILEYLKNLGGADVTLTLLNEVITPINCDEEFIKRVTRTYTATDAQGNQSPNCTYEILLRRFPHEDVVCPDDFSIQDENPLHCDDIFQLDANGNPHPSVTGVPTVGGIPLWPNQDFYCNINVSYEDLDLPKIGCVEKVMRLWTIREWWCSEEITTTCAQLIEIVDEEGPVVIAPRDMTATTAGGYVCEAIVDLPPAFVEDACSETTTVDVQYPGGFLKNQNGGRVRLPLGENEIIYIGYDECYNSTRDVMIVHVVDKTAPVAICDKHTVVGLTYDGYAHVYAKTFDDGSYDDCWIDSMAVKRMDDGEGCGIVEDEFGPYVTFCCADIANNDIMVRFRVYDASGNYGECMVEVTVQDKIPPHIKCPPNLTINCDFHLDRNDLSVFGNVVEDKSLQEPIGVTPPYLLEWDGPLYDGLAHDNCDLTIREDAEFDINQCNIGTIIRTFYASDPNGTVHCTQTIEIINIDPFYINPFDPQDTLDDIVWPLDYETFESCDIGSLHPDSLPAGFGRPAITEDKCDLVGATWKDHIFPFAGNQACFKIIRKWKVIDWCQFENGRYYQWEYEQIIKVNNDVAPFITTDCEPKSVCTFDPQCIDGEIELIAIAEDDCTPDEDLMWTFEIDRFNNGIFDLKVSGIGNTIDASGPYPVGQHRIKYSFEDRCGNKTFCIQEFEIVNCKAPIAYCQNGIVVTLMPMDTNGDGQVDDGMVEIWAEDFDAGSSHPCGYELTFSFDEDGTELARIYNCDSIANGNRLDVRIYITDENGNQSSCNNFIIIQDNSNACTNTIQSAVIAGRIATEESEHVSEVNVKLQGAGNVNFMTKDDGAYAFPPMPYGGQYTVIPARNDDYMNGVSTADLVAIQRHLLGLKNLDSPYKLIAADANASGDITAKDIVELRKLILGLTTELPGNTSWRFVDKGFVFPDPTNPFSVQWPEAYPINGLNTNMMNVDFIAVKVGDVNGTVKPNELLGTTVRSLAGTLQLEVEALQYTAGQQLEVPVYASNFDGITGYQFTLHFDNNQFGFNAIEAGQIEVSEANFGLNRTQDGIITTSWNGLETEVNADEPLFTLVFNAMQSGSLMDELYISSAVTAAEAYTVQNEAYNVRLQYRTSDAKGTFALYQNTPNPFADETMIRFHLPEAGEAALTIYDVNGKIIRRYEIQGTQGMNEQRILSGSLEASGILYYQLDTKNHTATKRMVVLK